MNRGGYLIGQGFRNIFKHGWMSFATVAIITVCLIIMGSVLLLSANIDALVSDLEQQNEVVAFVDESYTSDYSKQLEPMIKAIDNVATVSFVSRDDAMKNFMGNYDKELMEGIDPVLSLSGTGTWGRMDPLQLPAEDIADLVRLRIVIGYALVPFLKIVLVVATVGVHGPVIEFHHRIAHTVKEIAVVCNHQQSAAAATEIAFQEFYRLYVEVVGGLVHYQELGIQSQQFRQGDALDLTAGEFSHQAVGTAKPEARGQLAHALHEILPVLGRHALGLGMAVRDDLLLDGECLVVVVVLLQECYPDILQEEYLAAGIGLVLPCKDAQERSLARAVGRDERNLVALVDVEGDVLEQHFLPV